MKNWKRFFCMALALAMILALSACGAAKSAVPGGAEAAEPISMDAYSDPVEYYQAVELRGAENLLAVFTGAMNNANLGTGEMYRQGDLRLDLDQSALDRDLLDLITQSVGLDLSWVKSLGMKFLVGTDGKLLSEQMTLLFNDTELATADLVMGLEDKMVYAGVPEFSDAYMGFNMEEMMRSSYQMSGLDYDEIMALVKDLNLDANTVRDIFSTYLSLVIKDLNKVTVESGNVSASGVSCACNVATVTIDGETLLKVAQDVLTAARSDTRIEKIAYTALRASGKYSGTEEAFHSDYVSELDSALSDLSNTTPEDINGNAQMLVYIDENGDVLGRDISVESDGSPVFRLTALSARDGDNLGVDVTITSLNSYHSTDYYYDYETTFTMAGKGTLNDAGAITGNFQVNVISNSDYNGSVENENWDVGVVSVNGTLGSDGFQGELVLTPSDQILDMILEELYDAPQPVIDLIRSLSVAFVNNSKDGTADCALILRTNGKDLLTLSIHAQEASPFAISVPGNVTDPDTWANGIDSNAVVNLLIERLRTAGVPASVLNLISSQF